MVRHRPYLAAALLMLAEAVVDLRPLAQAARAVAAPAAHPLLMQPLERLTQAAVAAAAVVVVEMAARAAPALSFFATQSLFRP